MARTRNISIGVPAELHARYAELGMAARRAVLAEVRRVLERRLLLGVPTEPHTSLCMTAARACSAPGHDPAAASSTAKPTDDGLHVVLPNGW
jgi:hypothetical protein